VTSVSGLRRYRLWAIVIVITIVIVDQLTKWWAVVNLSDGSTISILPSVELDLTFNGGFSFGTGDDLTPVIGTIVCIVVVGLVVAVAREREPRRILLMGAVLGGAIGNLLDRLFRTDGGAPLTGEVVDFIDVSWYAVFNIADAVLVLAIIALVLNEWIASRRERATADVAAPAASDSADLRVDGRIGDDTGRGQVPELGGGETE
jgi:signal peptidase II